MPRVRWVVVVLTVLASVTLVAQRSLLNTALVVDGAGNLLVTNNAQSGSASGARSAANTLVKTDANGYLMVAMGVMPSLAVLSWNSDTGLSRTAAGTVGVGNGTQGDLTGTISAAAAVFSSNIAMGSTGRVFWSSRAQILSPSDGSLVVENNGQTIGSQLKADALPTVASGFGTSPTITAGSTALAGSVNVGTGGTATSGVINFNGTAFPSAPFCTATPTTSNVVQRVSTSTTQLTLTVTTAWTASDVIFFQCISSK